MGFTVATAAIKMGSIADRYDPQKNRSEGKSDRYKIFSASIFPLSP
jgi:hypothetical protein